MLASRTPTGDLGARAAVGQIVAGNFPDVREFRPEVPVALVQLLNACLSLDRRVRPASAGDLARRLEALAKLPSEPTRPNHPRF